MSAVVDDPCSPILCSSLPLFTPKPRSTRNAVNWPLSNPGAPVPRPSFITFANTTNRSAKPPLVIHIFSPLRTKLPSGCFVARVRAPRASEPDPVSLSPYAPIDSPDSSFGRYFRFCSSVPNRYSGLTVSFACAPNVAPNDADRDMRSLTISDVTLSRPRPPYSSGTSTPISPRSAARLTSCRASDQSFSSSLSSTGRISFATNSSAVRAMRRCSSVSLSGVKTSSGSPDCRSHSPPRAIVSVVVGMFILWNPATKTLEKSTGFFVSLPLRHCICLYIRSKIPAAPIPPPTHMVTMP